MLIESVCCPVGTTLKDPVRVTNWTVYVPVAVSVAVKLTVSDVPLGIWMVCMPLRVWPFISRLSEVDPFIPLLVTRAVIAMESPGHGSIGFIDRSLKMYPGIVGVGVGVGVGAWLGVAVGWDEVVGVERGEDVGEADGEVGGEVGKEVGEDDGEGP